MVQIISHPQLEYAEKILHDATPNEIENKKGRSIPELCGMPLKAALQLLHRVKFPFKCFGDGNGKVAYKTPHAGAGLEPETKIMLFTAPLNDAKLPKGTIMPNCVGRDLRNAINILNLKGLSPYIRGAGIVSDQSPRSGLPITSALQCTLSCSFEKKQYAME